MLEINVRGYYTQPQVYTTAQLLKRQSQGKFLTPYDKIRLQRYATKARLRNRNKKKN